MAREIRVTVDPPNIRAIVARIDKGEVNLQARISRTTTDITMTAITRVRGKALAMPVHGKKHRGRRAQLAKGVGRRRTKYGYRVTTSMPPGLAWFPREIMNQWHHPTYGHKPEDVQRPHYDWFIGPIQQLYGPMRNRLSNDIEHSVRDMG